jgi:hypothetical protein
MSGKWQRRILRTLGEAGHPLTTRSLRIRIGMTPAQDPTGSILRNALKRLRDLGHVKSPARGLHVLVPQPWRDPLCLSAPVPVLPVVVRPGR